MAKIPQETDYGARPSLRSNRVDVPGRGRLAVADAVVTAADTFVSALKDRKVKQDRFNYAMAKNELLVADLQNRELLKDDQDWETYDERYRTGLRTDRDRITSEYRLSPNDQAIFDAEADLVTERGAVQVGDYGRRVEIDDKVAGMSASLAAARESIVLADPLTRNDLLLTQLEAITALEDEGIRTAVEAEKIRQDFTQDVATASLLSMDTADAIELIKKSLAKRSGGPITTEDIRAGKGTGSIADFLHADVAKEMLDKLEREDKTTQDRIEAFAISDAAFEQFPLESQASERDKYIRKNSEGDVRAIASAAVTNRNIGMTRAEQGRKDALMESVREAIDEEGWNFNDIPADELRELSPAEVTQIRVYVKNVRESDGFGEFDNSDMEYAWRRMTDEEKVDIPLNSIPWKNAFTRDTWRAMLGEQDAYINAAKSTKDPNIYRGDPDDEVLRGMLIGGPNALWSEIPSKGTNDYVRYIRLDSDVNRALTDESLRRFAKTGTGYMSPQDIQEISAQVIGKTVFIDDWFGNTRTVLGALTPAERESGAIYVPIKDIRAEAGPLDSMGRPQNMEQYLRQFAIGDPSNRDIEKAYFLWITGDTAGAQALLAE